MGYNKETGMYEGFIYKITNNINGKIYIGQTIRTIQRRWNEHKREAIIQREHSKSKYLYSSMRLHDIKNFSIEEVIKVSSINKNELIKELDILEQEYIVKYKSLWTENGYNLTVGGGNGHSRGSEIIKYTTEGVFIGEYMSFSELSRIENVDVSTIERRCKQHLCIDGLTVLFFKNEIFDLSLITYPNLNIIKQYDKKGNLISIFHNTKELQAKTSFNICSILMCCRGEIKTSYGYIWRFGDDKFGNLDLKRKNNYRKINAYTLDKIFSKTFNTYKDAMYEYKIKYNTNLYRSLNNHEKTCYGFYWYYADDPEQPDKTKIIA